MYNHLYKYVIDDNILHRKQFSFQTGHSTEHAIIQLVDQINNSFEKVQYTLNIFINFLRSLTLLIKKL